MKHPFLLSWAFLGLIACSVAAEPPKSRTSTPHPNHEGEFKVRGEIMSKAASLLYRRNFVDLGKMEADYLRTWERTPSGISKIQVFNHSIGYSLGPVGGATCDIPGNSLIDEWMTAQPAAAAPLILKASKLVDRAFCWRGSKSASQVDEAAWAPFHRDIEAAHRLLDGHKAIASVNPAFYDVMEQIYLGEGRSVSEFEDLLDEASRRFPTYLPIYDAAYAYYQPQWFGGTAQIAALGKYMTERNRPTDGEGGYARFFWYASSTPCSCWRDAIDWPTMKQSMESVVQRYPDKWNYAAFAKIACEMDDADTAKLYFSKLGDGDGSEAWNGDDENWRRCRTLAGY